MSKMRIVACAAAVAIYAAPGLAEGLGHGVIRYGQTSGWLYDNRDDNRDFPTNGVFPGNYAARPAIAWIGAGGFAGGTPQRSAVPYPSQVVFGNISLRGRPRPRK